MEELRSKFLCVSLMWLMRRSSSRFCLGWSQSGSLLGKRLRKRYRISEKGWTQEWRSSKTPLMMFRRILKDRGNWPTSAGEIWSEISGRGHLMTSDWQLWNCLYYILTEFRLQLRSIAYQPWIQTPGHYWRQQTDLGRESFGQTASKVAAGCVTNVCLSSRCVGKKFVDIQLLKILLRLVEKRNQVVRPEW